MSWKWSTIKEVNDLGPSIYLSKCLKCFEENNGGRKHTSIMISIWKRIWFENSSLGPDATLPVILVANLL